VLRARGPLDHAAHALARAITGDRERAIAAAREQAHELVGELVGAQARDADLTLAVDDIAHDRRDIGMVRDGRADEPDLRRVLRNARDDRLARHDAHAAVRRSPHHAVGAAARATARRLGHEHRRELGVGRLDLRARRQERVVDGSDLRHRLAVQMRQVHSGAIRERRPHALSDEPDVARDRHQLDDQLFAFAQDDRVEEWRERRRIRERQRPTGDHERVAMIALRR